ESVLLRIRLAQTGETMFETTTYQLGLALPIAGRFHLEFRVQMNVPSGIYLVETAAWNRLAARESFAGPSGYVDVRPGLPFRGLVQMNPQVELQLAAEVPDAGR